MKKVILYFKLLIIAIVTILDTIKMLIQLALFGSKGFRRTAKVWADKVLWIIGVQIETKGLENVNRSESYIFAANHSSLMDIPVLQSTIPVDFRIIYKKELEKVPIWGYGLKKSPYIGIIREDPREAMKSVEEAIESIKAGDSVLIYPEGTRSPDGELQEFKRGAFMMASRSGKPIIPVAIVGSNKILPNKKLELNSGKVRLVFGKPIFMEVNSREDERKLMEKVYEALKNMLEIEKNVL